MGSQQSKTQQAAANEKAAHERPRTLNFENDMVQVNDKNEKGDLRRLDWKAEALPVSAVTSWQTDMLKNPKNR